MSCHSRIPAPAVVLLLLALASGRAETGWVRLAPDGRGFVAGEPARAFRPLGFNYDHAECRAGGTIADALTLGWLELFQREALRRR